MQPKAVTLRKRSQIALANRMMFLWIAGVSVVFGVSLVVAIFLVQMLVFNERVLSEKDRTVSTLTSDYAAIGVDSSDQNTLESKVRALDTNQALIDSKAKPDDQALQVVLDALPSDANSLALGASLQNKLLSGISGVTLNSLQVDPVVGVESIDTTSVSSGDNQITFHFSVSGDVTALKQVLHNLEISIRTIDITSLKIENQGKSQVMTIQGRAFYEPARIVQLKDKTVK